MRHKAGTISRALRPQRRISLLTVTLSLFLSFQVADSPCARSVFLTGWGIVATVQKKNMLKSDATDGA